jgi:Ca2+-binding RTX toxin-like protein
MAASSASRFQRCIRGRALAIGTVAATGGVFFLIMPAASAWAGSGGVTSASTLEYQANSGEDNAVTVSRNGPNIVVLDRGTLSGSSIPVTVDTSLDTSSLCTVSTTYNPHDTMNCPAAGITTERITTLDGADSARLDSSLTGPSTARLDGGSGDDQLENDSMLATTFVGGQGVDALTGGPGSNDTADYSAAAAGVTVSLRSGTASSDGDGTSDTLSGIRNVLGSASGDTIEGDGGNNTLSGGPGSDTVSYAGAPSGVTVDLASVTATGDGTDALSGFENVTGSGHADVLSAAPGGSTLNGGGGNDSLTARDGFDILNGGPGNDTLSEGAGPAIDTLDGGTGSDTLDYSGSTAPLTLADLDGGFAVTTLVHEDFFVDVENLIGTPFADTLLGSPGDNVINGGGGDDLIRAGTGNDTIIGGGGNDTADFGGAAGGVDADLGTGTATGEGTDSLTGIENLTGSSYADRLSGDATNNVLNGGPGDDVLDGRGGQDSLIGGGGTDTADYSDAPNGVTVDLAAGTASGWGLDALSAIANVTGSPYADQITGDGNANALSGGGGDDVITGGDGGDTVAGGLGNDTLLIQDGVVDTADCGPGTDAVTADTDDSLTNCEPGAAGGPTATTTTVTSSRNPSELGQLVTFTAAGGPTAGNTTMAFYADGSSTPLPGCGAVGLTSVGGSYQATCSTSGLAIGSHPIRAVYSGDAGYVGSEQSLSGGQQIDPMAQQITFPLLASKSIVDLPFTIQGVTGGASANPVTFTAGGACSVAGATVTLLHTGTCTLTAHQAGNADYAAAPDVSRSFAVVGKPKVTIADVNTAEGNSGTHLLNFRVTLNRAVTVPVTVHWTTANGTAKAPGDFVAGTGTLTFAPGQTVQTLSVTIKGDRTRERNEVFYVLLSNPQQASITDANASGGIRNDD